MHSDYEESGGIHKSENAPNSPETGSVNPEDSSKEVHAKFMKDNLGSFEGEVTINEAKAQERESSILEAGFTGIPSEFDDGIHPYFSLNSRPCKTLQTP